MARERPILGSIVCNETMPVLNHGAIKYHLHVILIYPGFFEAQELEETSEM